MQINNLTYIECKNILENYYYTLYNTTNNIEQCKHYLVEQLNYYVRKYIFSLIESKRKNIKGLNSKIDDKISCNKINIWNGELTEGCKNCLCNKITTIRSVGSCNLNCNFCYYDHSTQKIDILDDHFYFDNSIMLTKDIIKDMFNKNDDKNKIKAISWVSWELFTNFNKHIDLWKFFSDKGYYQYVYTNGTLCTEEHFKIMQDSGISELRFNLAATLVNDKVLDTMKIARKYFKYLCIESPMFNQYWLKFKEKRNKILDTGVDHINSAELHIANYHTIDYWKNTEGKLYFSSNNYISPINSRLLTYDMIKLAEEEKWSIVINDCSNDTKLYRSMYAVNNLNIKPEQVPKKWGLYLLDEYKNILPLKT